MQTVPPPELKMVEIEINHNCNRACSYCPNSVSERKSKGEMSTELYEKLMQQLVDINYQGSISHMFYNEPMLAKKIDWFIETTRIYLPKNSIIFYSNGTLLSLEKFRKFISLGVTRFIITKHEHTKNYIFDEVFQQLTEEEKIRVKFQNFTQLKFTNRGGIVNAGPTELAHLTPCFIPSFLIVVTLTGNILPCFEDFHEANVMGNINDMHLKDIWESNTFSVFRDNLKHGKRHVQKPCDKCNRIQVCYE